MTWGIKRRARASNILADLGKIITAAAVIGPLVQPTPAATRNIVVGFVIALACFAGALWSEQEKEGRDDRS